MTTTTAEGRSILGDLESLNLKSVGEEEEDEEDVSSGGVDMSLGKVNKHGPVLPDGKI